MHGNKSPRSTDASAFHRPVLVALLAVLFLAVVMLWQDRQRLHKQLANGVTTRLPGGSSISLDATSGDTSCSFAVTPSQFADSCALLRDACVDQGSIILYGDEDARRLQKADGPGYELIEPTDENYRRCVFTHRSGGRSDFRFRLPPIRVRPASTAEGAAYLVDPLFSSCTVPIVWYPFERLSNFAHVYRDNAAKLLGALQVAPWAASHAKLVFMTAEGLAAPAWNYDILQPLSPLRVETWSDFSSRLPAAPADGSSSGSGGSYVPADWAELQQGAAVAAAAAAAGHSLPLSAEGGPQRCFRNMFVCRGGLNVTEWPLHGLGLRLVEHYRSLLPAAEGGGAAAAATEETKQQQKKQHAAVEPVPKGSSGIGGDSSSSRGERVLRILFHKRGSPDRQLLNVAELLERCNDWQYTSKGGRRLRASCAEVEPTSLLSGMAAAQDADVFVGVHGANMANAWLMRPGSSMIELQPFGFDEGPAHLQYPLFNTMDNETAVLWWLISVCDPQASTPGTAEVQALGAPGGWPKDRNLRVRWDVLREVLETTVEVGGDMSDYRQRWKEGRWWWWMGSGGGLSQVGPGRATEMRCPKKEQVGGKKQQEER